MFRYIVLLFLQLLPASRFFRFRRLLLNLVDIEVDQDTSVCSPRIYGRGDLRIGKSCWISLGCVFYTHIDVPITISDYCDVGPNVHFIPGGHFIGCETRRAGAGRSGPILVKSGGWIGANSTILGGVTIGRGSVVAAGSVVTCNVPDNVLVAGVPAKIKRYLI